MGLIIKENGADFEKPPAGTQAGVCTNYVDIGMQTGKFGEKHKLVILFEIEARKTKGEFAGKRFVVSKEYGVSLNEKSTLRKDLESWRGRPFTAEELAGFDMDKIKGKPCMLNLMESAGDNGKTWINIASIIPPMKGQAPMTPETPEYIPEWIMKKVSHQGEVKDNFKDDDPGDSIAF
jgi:hypothetical protein